MLKSLRNAGLLAAALVVLAAGFAPPAEARIVCREGWRWNSYHCVQIPGWRVAYHPRPYYYHPYHPWQRVHYYHRPYYNHRPPVIVVH